MENKKGLSAETIIIAIVAIIVIVAIIYFGMTGKKDSFTYGTVEAKSSAPNTFIEDYKSYRKFISKVETQDEITINYKKYSMKEKYNEDFFNSKKLGVIVVSEDTSKEYIRGIVDVIYNKERTEATVKYEYRTAGYAGTLSRSWQTCMIVELDNTVTNVNFVLDNDASNNKK